MSQDAPLPLSDSYSNFAFLVHSQSSLAGDLAPRVDNVTSTRQKRKRTSAQDHATLEAAYLRNSKPDKSERAEIVKRVDLGEKEVQIWFQNRRQNDRRKSRPLLPHELLPHFRNGVPEEILQQSFGTQPTVNEAVRTQPPSTEANPIATKDAATAAVSDQTCLCVPIVHNMNGPTPDDQNITSTAHELCERVNLYATPSSSLDSNTASPRTGTGHGEGHVISKKRVFDEMNGILRKEPAELMKASIPSLVQSSTVRLSRSLDGAVKVRTNDEETPSPPKERAPPPQDQQRRSTALRRSTSVTSTSVSPQTIEAEQATPDPFKGTFGRSRDSRTWEFYCDSDARDALSAHAETERTGSAVSAISLIRSQSQNAARLQAMTPKPVSTNIRMDAGGRRPQKGKMSRTKSSMGRMESGGNDSSAKMAKNGRLTQARSPSGDSDKENWAPGTTQSSSNLLRRPRCADGRQSGGDAGVLRETHGVGSREQASSRSLGSRSHMERMTADKEKDKAGDDLECINGLLSLSQGMWT